MRRVNSGAEAWLGAEIPVLNKGSATLVDYLGDDLTVVEAARVSYGRGIDEADTQRNIKLIHYLIKNEHWSPVEQCSLVFNITAPLFVIAEIATHRTAKRNQFSARYAEMADEFYVPALGRVKEQSKSNKQGSGEPLPPGLAQDFIDDLNETCSRAFKAYQKALNMGVAKELARSVLPVGTYSKLRWQMDLRNLLHFLTLRRAPNAQEEIREYANAMAAVVADAFPIVWQAYAQTLDTAKQRTEKG